MMIKIEKVIPSSSKDLDKGFILQEIHNKVDLDFTRTSIRIGFVSVKKSTYYSQSKIFWNFLPQIRPNRGNIQDL